MFFHSFLLGGLGPNWSWLSRYGWMGVDLFFVLSGFLIGAQVFKPLASGEKLSYTDFYIRRASRILPAYLVVLLLYWAWPGFREAPGIEPLWKFLGFFVNISIDYGLNSAFSHAWSLCVEEHFYWVFPALAVLMLRRPSFGKFAAMYGIVVFGGIALRSLIWLRGMEVDPALSRNWFVEDIYYPSWCRLDGLLCGVALAALKAFRPRAWDRARRHANGSLIAGVLILAVSFWLFRDRVGLLGNSIGWPILSVALGMLVFAAAERDNFIGSLEFSVAGWFAAISYSLYLMHKATYHLIQQHWGRQLENQGFLAFLVYSSTAVLAGAVLHYAVERPCLQLRKLLTTSRGLRQVENTG